jgi:DNA (cytosine-5)-methyltransferase 1
MLTSRGLGRVLGDLAAMGFDARWGVLGAADVGAKHQRDRIWIVAKWRGQFSHAQHNRIRRWEQQQKSFKKEANDSYANIFNDALRGNSKDYEEGLGEWGIHTRGSVSDSWQRCEEVAGQSPNMANTQMFRQSPCDITPHHKPRRNVEGQPWGGGHEYARANYWQTEPNVGRVVDGLAARVDRLKAIGNGQVPLCAATAWRILSEL